MKRWMVIATALATMSGTGGLVVTAAEAEPLRPHAPIDITADDFTPENGVTNGPDCGGVLEQACSIDGWNIKAAPGASCITISDTRKRYVIQNTRCSGGTIGIVLTDAPEGNVVSNTISGLNGSARSPTATGIAVNRSPHMTIADNRLSNIQGRPGNAAGASGGDALGIHVRDSEGVDIVRNDVSLLAGGYGYLGSLGKDGANGGNGGNGGSATAILAEQTPPSTLLASLSTPPLRSVQVSVLGSDVTLNVGPLAISGLTLRNNTIARVYGGVGAVGGFGGFGSGGNGGDGGNATGVMVKGLDSDSYDLDSMKGNSISWIVGAVGAVGAAGWNGGMGGNGGSGQGVVLTNVGSGADVSGNSIFQLYGALGAAAGWGAAHAGNGGDGGDGIGIRKGAVALVDNVISFFFAGFGGAGGLPDGVLGRPGQAAAVL
jgi:Periplasmic copper-binding protein (NosD)